jgi:hypothetical protein
MNRYSFVYNWSSQKDGFAASHGQGVHDCRRDHADRDQAGKEVAQVPVRLASRFALLDLDLRQQFLALAVSPVLSARDLSSSRDPVGLNPVALALLRIHSTGLRLADSHGVKSLPPPFALNGEDRSGTV